MLTGMQIMSKSLGINVEKQSVERLCFQLHYHLTNPKFDRECPAEDTKNSEPDETVSRPNFRRRTRF